MVGQSVHLVADVDLLASRTNHGCTRLLGFTESTPGTVPSQSLGRFVFNYIWIVPPLTYYSRPLHHLPPQLLNKVHLTMTFSHTIGILLLATEEQTPILTLPLPRPTRRNENALVRPVLPSSNVKQRLREGRGSCEGREIWRKLKKGEGKQLLRKLRTGGS